MDSMNESKQMDLSDGKPRKLSMHRHVGHRALSALAAPMRVHPIPQGYRGVPDLCGIPLLFSSSTVSLMLSLHVNICPVWAFCHL